MPYQELPPESFHIYVSRAEEAMNGLIALTVKYLVIVWTLLCVLGTSNNLVVFSLGPLHGSVRPSPRNRNEDCSFVNRRSFLMRQYIMVVSPPAAVAVVSALLLHPPAPAHALGEGEERMIFKQKPTAPMAALIPAVQQRLLLQASLEFLKKGDIEKVKQILSPLDGDYMPNIFYGQQNMNVIKKYNPAKVLRGDLVRATMNLYQTNLNYNDLLGNPTDAFIITDPAWKKSFIRENGGLPALQRVIGADLDMRQLLRNQVQLKIDDAAAELYAPDRDDEELTALLEEAARNFDLWMDRVRTGDVRDALQAILSGESVQVFETVAAGFLAPPPHHSLALPCDEKKNLTARDGCYDCRCDWIGSSRC